MTSNAIKISSLIDELTELLGELAVALTSRDLVIIDPEAHFVAFVAIAWMPSGIGVDPRSE